MHTSKMPGVHRSLGVLALFTVMTLPATAWSQVRIGQTAGFSGPVAAGVKETTDGARLYLDAVNARGGVHGQPVELVSMDDKFDPKLAADNAKVLVGEKQVVGLFLTRGTPHTQAILPLLAEHNVQATFFFTGKELARQPELAKLVLRAMIDLLKA